MSPQIISFILSILYPMKIFCTFSWKAIYYSYIHAISSFILKDYISQASDKILEFHFGMNSCQTNSSSCNCFKLKKNKICAC